MRHYFLVSAILSSIVPTFATPLAYYSLSSESSPLDLSRNVDSYPEPAPTASLDLTEFSTEDRPTFDTSEPFLASTPDKSSCTSNVISNKLQKRDSARCELKKGRNSDPAPSDAGLLDPSFFSILSIPDGTACRHPKYPKHLCCNGPVGRSEKMDGYVHMGYVNVCFLFYNRCDKPYNICCQDYLVHETQGLRCIYAW